MAGSADLYQEDGRAPFHSINFVTSHDGFTLMDLVSYNEKHNEANGENNADGSDENHSWNCGEEGPSSNPAVNRLRKQQMKNLVSILLLSQGVPMILAGDEMGRTQQGNNNPYCQDNEISWLNWRPATPEPRSVPLLQTTDSISEEACHSEAQDLPGPGRSPGFHLARSKTGPT